MNTAQKGFTLIELMIVIAIIGILAAIAIPAYQNYIKKAAYSEVITAMAPYKTAVDLCYAESLALTGCNAGTNGIPAAIASETTANLKRAVDTIDVAAGVITATPFAFKGIAATETCVATPEADASKRLVWTYSGACVTNGYVKSGT